MAPNRPKHGAFFLMSVTNLMQHAPLLRTDRRKPPVSGEGVVLAAGIALASALLVGVSSRRSAAAPARRQDPADACAVGMRRGSAVLGTSVLMDSAFEHFRGNYDNRLMYVPP